MTGFEQPSLLVVAYATGVLMFFAPCSVGLLPAYLTYVRTIVRAEPQSLRLRSHREAFTGSPARSEVPRSYFSAGTSRRIRSVLSGTCNTLIAWFALSELSGYDAVVNYDGSWIEWGNLVDVSIETGEAERTK